MRFTVEMAPLAPYARNIAQCPNTLIGYLICWLMELNNILIGVSDKEEFNAFEFNLSSNFNAQLFYGF